MPVIKPESKIFDSSGNPANGYIYVTASRPFDSELGHITTARAVVQVINGVARSGGQPWHVPATPPGVTLSVEQDLDGHQMRHTSRVFVPDVTELTFTELLFNRGGEHAGTDPYWWNLAGSADFPGGALDGDLGYDTNGNVWRYNS